MAIGTYIRQRAIICWGYNNEKSNILINWNFNEALNLFFCYIRMFPAILGAIVVSIFFIEIQKRKIDRIFDKLERERNKYLQVTKDEYKC